MVAQERPIRVLIVDDSAVVRQILTHELSRQPGVEVIGSACDPFVARDKILRDKPDVLTLDLEMPRMDGLEFLQRIMVHHPLPVIVLSSHAEHGTRVALDALEYGAVDVLAKPSGISAQALAHLVEHLTDSIRSAAKARLNLPQRNESSTASVTEAATSERNKHSLKADTPSQHLIVIGVSTGGTEALKQILPTFPPEAPGTLVVIHMPVGFTQRYAERLDSMCQMQVREATDDELVTRGKILIAPGDQHLSLYKSESVYRTRLNKGAPINRHRPSVDALFHSVAEFAPRDSLGIILTGMGADGSRGLLAMRSAGAHTIAQDENSCVIFGMPKEAIRLAAACEVLSLSKIPEACKRWVLAR